MKYLSVVTSWVLIAVLSFGNALAQTKITAPNKQAEFKKHIVEWGTNKQVNVKLNSGEKISGRIAEIQNDFFTVQAVTKDGQVSSHQINFSDLNKLSAKGQAGRAVGYTALGIMAAVGAVFVMFFVIYAVNES